MKLMVKKIACLVATLVALVLPATAAFAQADPTLPTPPSLPPGIPTVVPPVVDPAAPPVPPEPPLADPSPKVALVMAQLHIFDVQKILDAAQVSLDVATADEARARATRDAVKQDRDDKRQVLTDVATNAYVHGGIDTAGQDPTMAEYLPAESARLLTTSAVTRDQERLHDAEDRLRTAEHMLGDAVAATTQAHATRDAAQAGFEEATLAVNDARRLTSAKDVSPTVMGDAVLTADELVGWYNAQGIQGYAGRVDLATMAAYYIDEGKAEGIRGDVAFAQSIVETGAFTSPLTTHNNFSGIGACDSCPTGFDFKTPQLGVRAQAQLLHAYADKGLHLTSLANPAVGSNPDHLSVRGCCTTWNKLTGTWATDPNYGPKLMTVYLSMLQYALAQRSQPPPDVSSPLPALPGH
jgi:flagellum-specific peptidoglycan hydrolase FlgJ